MSETIRPWSDDPYWTDALDCFYALRNSGEAITLDVAGVESAVFDGSGPAYRLIDAMCSVKHHEGQDSFRGAPRLALAMIAILAASQPSERKPVPPSVLNLASARMTVVSALAWRCIAELFRRYRSRHVLKIYQVHPGSSLRGQLVVALGSKPSANQPALTFNLGGNSGTFTVFSRVDDVPAGDYRPATGSFASGMLGEDPASAVSEIARCWGLPAAGGHLPPTDKASITPRVIAGLIERKIPEASVWRTTSAYADSSSVGPMLSGWHSVFGASKREDVSLSRYVLLHQAAGDAMVQQREAIQGVAWCFDLATGSAIPMSASAAGTRLDLVAEYQRNGRHLPRLLRQLEVQADALAGA